MATTPKRQIRLTREGWYFLFVPIFSLTGAILREVNVLLLFSGMLVGAMLLCWRGLVVMLRGLEVRRKLPGALCAGDTMAIDLTLSNPHRRISGWALVVNDSVHRAAPVSEDSPVFQPYVLFPKIAPVSEETLSCRGRVPARGMYRFGPLRITSRFPLGLIQGTVTFEQYDTLVVLPRLGVLNRRWEELHRDAVLGSRSTQRQPGLIEGDFYGLRDWRSGDARRWIHWRTSARRGTLVVRQFEQPRSQDMAILVDLWQPSDADSQARENVELTISLVATVIADLCRRRNGRILLGIAGAKPQAFQGPASSGFMQEIMEQLALTQSGVDVPMEEMLAQAMQEFRVGMRVVVLSTRGLDLRECREYDELLQEPVKRGAVDRAQYIHSGSDQIFDFFSPE